MILKKKREGWCTASTLVAVVPIFLMVLLMLICPILFEKRVSEDQFKLIDSFYNEDSTNENGMIKDKYSILSYRTDDKNKYMSVKFNQKLSYKYCSDLSGRIYKNYKNSLKYLHINNKNIVYKNRDESNVDKQIIKECKNHKYNTINFSLNKNKK